ncbi:MAG: hypothetical protein APF80_11375 [Alphaproteobacteria bacterium BRH_c36]|nr:MAG: hypothetical protein APF80_11375 [Alphaproteobacteria bacterium BRH_c36]
MKPKSSESRPVNELDDHKAQLEQSITELGAAILKLKNEHEAEDAEIATELEERYAELRREFDEFKSAGGSSGQFSGKAAEALKGAKNRFSTAYNDFKDYATNEERTAKWKQGAQEVGHGVSRAWSKVSDRFDSAYQRLQNRSRGDDQNR